MPARQQYHGPKGGGAQKCLATSVSAPRTQRNGANPSLPPDLHMLRPATALPNPQVSQVVDSVRDTSILVSCTKGILNDTLETPNVRDSGGPAAPEGGVGDACESDQPCVLC